MAALATRLVFAIVLVLAWGPVGARADDETLPPDIEFFTNRDCRHCEAAAEYLAGLQADRPELVVVTRHILEDEGARERFAGLVEQAGVQAASTPAFLVQGKLIIGWTSPVTTGRLIEDILEGLETSPEERGGAGCVVDLSRAPGEAQPPCVDPRDQAIDLPLFGSVKPRDLGLPVFTVVLGLVDGFNPCAMWVLLFLLSLLVHLNSRSRMFAIAGTFVLVSGLVYFAFMAAWFTFFDVIGKARAIQVILGAVAVFIGAVHAKDFFAFHKGLTFSIPESAKPGIYARVNRILKAENMKAALVTVVVLAFMVNVVELLCTAGLPAIYTNVLAQHELPRAQYYGYIALYQVFYMLDDMAMLSIAIFTLSRTRLQETGGRWLKLVSGVVMIALGLALVFKPGLLSW
ncbi:MAG: NrdH-redoxin [Planctomycetota bacterium]